MKLKDANNNDVEQDVSTDGDTVLYHVTSEGIETWILQDFDKVV